jgi:hypothetical protein
MRRFRAVATPSLLRFLFMAAPKFFTENVMDCKAKSRRAGRLQILKRAGPAALPRTGEINAPHFTKSRKHEYFHSQTEWKRGIKPASFRRLLLDGKLVDRAIAVVLVLKILLAPGRTGSSRLGFPHLSRKNLQAKLNPTTVMYVIEIVSEFGHTAKHTARKWPTAGETWQAWKPV